MYNCYASKRQMILHVIIAISTLDTKTSCYYGRQRISPYTFRSAHSVATAEYLIKLWVNLGITSVLEGVAPDRIT
ncbi:predicted protein [Botrytis cinerea T4]|uniref:Uncharacterized protein n=1 Tax=Botryotinia fuckeliana (strain T4) TaxID=999810 RepID=G2YRL6_BOTF4|nr:predicted protein [Botrytis cinerea T4]